MVKSKNNKKTITEDKKLEDLANELPEFITVASWEIDKHIQEKNIQLAFPFPELDADKK